MDEMIAAVIKTMDDLKEAIGADDEAQPYVVMPRWLLDENNLKDGDMFGGAIVIESKPLPTHGVN